MLVSTLALFQLLCEGDDRGYGPPFSSNFRGYVQQSRLLVRQLPWFRCSPSGDTCCPGVCLELNMLAASPKVSGGSFTAVLCIDC